MAKTGQFPRSPDAATILTAAFFPLRERDSAGMKMLIGAAAFLTSGCATSDHPMNRPGGPDERVYNNETQKFEGRTDATGTAAAKRL